MTQDLTGQSGMAAKKPGILIVDDLRENRRMLARTLSTLEVEIHEAESGAEALEIVAREPALFVALLDVRMPHMDGYTLAERLRSLPQSATLPLIFISAHDSDTYHHHRAYETGAVDFLNKPVSPRILLSKVRVFLEAFLRQSELEALVKRLDAVNTTLSKQTVRLETSAEVISQIVSLLDIDELLTKILELIRDRFGYAFAGIWLLNKHQGVKTVALRAGQYGTPTPVHRPGDVIAMDAPQSIIAHVCLTGVPYLSNNTKHDPHYLSTPELPFIQSELALPLRFGEGLLGALDIQSESLDAFSSQDVAGLSTLADQIAVAIRNARLYAEVTRLNEELEAKVQERTKQLETAYHHLELLDRNKSDFIAVVSHELRTPLTLVSGFSELLSDDPAIETDTTRRQAVEGILTGAHRMHATIDSMLDVVKIDGQALQLHWSQLSLGTLLNDLVAQGNAALEQRTLTVTLDGLDDLPNIEADREALIKVFSELLSNAIKYTPDGGRITVSGELLASAADADTDYVEIVIHDTGIGIPTDMQEIIFSKFYSTGEVTFHSSGKTKFKGGGPGLGLPIARGIVAAHGGHVWAESPGYNEARLPGSSFHVVLPVAQAPRSFAILEMLASGQDS